jgi:uroporphyrinogen-III synthase
MELIPDSRTLGSTCVAAVGPATGEALGRYRIVPDLLPDRQHAEGLLEAFPDPPAPAGSVVLFPRAAEGSEVLVAGLELAGWDVDLIEAYQTVTETVADQARAEVASADAICFASSSSVTGFAEAFGADAAPPTVVCIGPATAETAKRFGLRVDAIAKPHTIGGLIDALIGAISASSSA